MRATFLTPRSSRCNLTLTSQSRLYKECVSGLMRDTRALIHPSCLCRVEELLLERLDLFEDGTPTRAALGVAALDARLKVEHVVDVVAKVLRDRLEVVQREVGQRDATFLRKADARARDVVSLSEGDL